MDRSGSGSSPWEAECRESVSGAGGHEPAEFRAGHCWTTRQEGVPIQSSVGSRRDSGSWGCPDPQPGRASVQCQDRSQGCGEARAGSVHAEVLKLAPQISFVFCKQDRLGPGSGQPAGGCCRGTGIQDAVPAEMGKGAQLVTTFLSPS